MATEVLNRERKSAKRGKTYEYRFETASISGKRHQHLTPVLRSQGNSILQGMFKHLNIK